MVSNFESCKKDVQEKIKTGKIKKSFRCDKNGNSNPRGRSRCRTNEFAICHKLRRGRGRRS